MVTRPVNIEGIAPIAALIDALSKKLINTSRLMGEISTYAMFRIKSRTLTGKSVSGRDFEPYTEKYAMFRIEHGRPARRVDLFFSGSMLSAMDYEVSANTATLFFQNTSDQNNVRNPLKAFWNDERRNFFALSDEDISNIQDIVIKYANS